jgi:hypothetical protein
VQLLKGTSSGIPLRPLSLVAATTSPDELAHMAAGAQQLALLLVDVNHGVPARLAPLRAFVCPPGAPAPGRASTCKPLHRPLCRHHCPPPLPITAAHHRCPSPLPATVAAQASTSRASCTTGRATTAWLRTAPGACS